LFHVFFVLISVQVPQKTNKDEDDIAKWVSNLSLSYSTFISISASLSCNDTKGNVMTR